MVHRVASRANDQLVRDLPVIENIETYEYADSVEFLKQLDKSGLFASEGDDSDAM